LTQLSAGGGYLAEGLVGKAISVLFLSSQPCSFLGGVGERDPILRLNLYPKHQNLYQVLIDVAKNNAEKNYSMPG
jgi:hypothetical protein